MARKKMAVAYAESLQAHAANDGEIPRGVLRQPRLVKTPGKARKLAPLNPIHFAPAKGMPPSIEMRHPDELMIDDSYQRSIHTKPSQRLVASIAANWDWRLCMPLVVSRRRDGLYVIDGQHRLTAAKLRGDIHFLPCCVGEYESPAHEASMFVGANRVRRAINRLDELHAAIIAGDKVANDVHNVVTMAGLKISRMTGSQSWQPGEVAFTASIKRMLRKHSLEVCTQALAILADAFPDQVLYNGAPIFLALVEIVSDGTNELNRADLIRELRSLDVKRWNELLEKTSRGGEKTQAVKDFLARNLDKKVPA